MARNSPGSRPPSSDADLCCHEPFCRERLAWGLGFILVGKPSSHPLVDEWLEHLGRNGAVRTVVRTRRETDTYRYARAIPLRDADDALAVNGCELVSYGYPIPLETRIDEHSGGAKSAPDQSFISAYGVTWTDNALKSVYPNVALKVFGGE